ncbi:unnamed protein product [Oikopleura dioica]|uniref:Uncharacterized protein n=1 Tax=Oikopleura dioica TaxID=34765 RepID=E4XW98_OIKDI|nr:unnamed protein product [Oikopleura dioica]
MKLEEDQFSSAQTQQAPVRKSLMELKRELVQKQVQREDKKKFEINPRPVPGSAESRLPSTVKTIVREVDLNQQTKPMSKQPSRFYKFAEPEKADSTTISAKKLRIKQRQEKVAEKMTTVAPTDKPPVDVFKSIFSDSVFGSSDSESENESSDDDSSALTIKKKPEQTSTSKLEAEPQLEAAKRAGPAPLQWSRQGSMSIPAPPAKTDDVKAEKVESDDEFTKPKFVFTSKKDRQTTKSFKKLSKNTSNVKLEQDMDDFDSTAPALPAEFKISNATEFPTLGGNDAQVISSDSDENCWEVMSDKKPKKKKSKKKKKEKKEKKEKKSKKSKR